MSYVSPNAPIPGCGQGNCGGEQYDALAVASNPLASAAATNAAVLNALQTIGQLAPPASFVALGLPVAAQVVSAQQRIATANRPVSGNGNLMARSLPAPKFVPLNVSEQEYNGCCFTGGPQSQQVQYQTPQRITIPPAPTVVPTPQGELYLQPAPSAPPYMPPAPVQQPHTMVLSGPGRAQPAALPVGRYMSIVQNPNAVRGLGAVWGDAGSVPCGSNWEGQQSGGMPGWGWLVIVGLVGWGLANKGRR